MSVFKSAAIITATLALSFVANATPPPIKTMPPTKPNPTTRPNQGAPEIGNDGLNQCQPPRFCN